MVQTCCVCGARWSKDCGNSFRQIPNDLNLLDRESVAKLQAKNYHPRKNSRVCAQHFLVTDDDKTINSQSAQTNDEAIPLSGSTAEYQSSSNSFSFVTCEETSSSSEHYLTSSTPKPSAEVDVGTKCTLDFEEIVDSWYDSPKALADSPKFMDTNDADVTCEWLKDEGTPTLFPNAIMQPAFVQQPMAPFFDTSAEGMHLHLIERRRKEEVPTSSNFSMELNVPNARDRMIPCDAKARQVTERF